MSQHVDADLEKVAGKALTILSEYFDEDPEARTKDGYTMARLAAGVLATWTKHKAAENASIGLSFGMASALAEDQSDLRNWIRKAMPNHPVVKALPTGSNNEVPAEFAISE